MQNPFVDLQSIYESKYSNTPIEGHGTIYYVSNNGNDSNDGLSPETAWKTITRATHHNYISGDALLFNRGETYNGVLSYFWGLSSTENNPITIGSYGTGDRPILTTVSIQTNLSWYKYSTNIWKAANSPKYNPQRVIVNNKEILTAASLNVLDDKQYQWYYDNENKELYLYSREDPNTLDISFSSIDTTVKISNNSYINIQDLNIQGGASYSILIKNSTNIKLMNLTVGKYGYKAIYIVGSFDQPSHDITIHNCIVDAEFKFNYENSSSSHKGNFEGITLTRNVYNNYIYNNIIKNWGHANINLFAPKPFETNSVHDNYVYKNYVTSPDIAYGGRINIDGNANHNYLYQNFIKNISVRNQIGGHDNNFSCNIIDTVHNSPIKEYATGQGIAMQSYSAPVYNNIIEYNTVLNTDSFPFFISGNLLNGDLYNNKINNNIFYASNTSKIIVVEKPFITETQKGLEYNNTFNNNTLYTNKIGDKLMYHYESLTLEKFNNINSKIELLPNQIIDPKLKTDYESSLPSLNQKCGVYAVSIEPPK